MYRCTECGHEFKARQIVDSREVAYAGRLYEPDTIMCPECGSDEVDIS